MARQTLTRRPWEPVTLLIGIMVLLLATVPSTAGVTRLREVGHPATLVALLLFAAWMLSRLYRRFLPRGAQPMRWLVWLCLATTLAVYVAGLWRGMTHLQEESAIWEFLAGLGFFGIILATADGVRSIERLTGVVGIALLGGAIIAAVAMAREVGLLDSAGTVGDTELGILAALLLPLCIHIGRFGYTRSARHWSALCGVLMVVVLALAVSASALVVLGLALLVLLPQWSWRTRFNFVVPGVLLAAGLVYIVPSSGPTVTGLFTEPELPWLRELAMRDIPQTVSLAGLHLGAIVLAAIGYRRSSEPAHRHLCACLIAFQLGVLAVGLMFEPFGFHHYVFFVAIMTGAAAAMFRLAAAAGPEPGLGT